jgi:peptidoglycan/xylan/chitin deacetylase (PgdA/CDA1 family)
MKPAVLCFHAASAEWSHRFSVPPEQILRLVKAIRRMRPVHVTFDDAYRDIGSVLPALLDQGFPVTIFVCTKYADEGGAPLTVPELADEDRARLATMGWEELHEWRDRGAGVGSHTVTHPRLLRLSDAELGREFVDSRERIEDATGRPCGWLAYPYGEHDDRVRNAARRAGYERGFTLRSAGTDPYASPRIDLYRRDSVPRALLKASLVSPALVRLVDRLQGPSAATG